MAATPHVLSMRGGLVLVAFLAYGTDRANYICIFSSRAQAVFLYMLSRYIYSADKYVGIRQMVMEPRI